MVMFFSAHFRTKWTTSASLTPYLKVPNDGTMRILVLDAMRDLIEATG